MARERESEKTKDESALILTGGPLSTPPNRNGEMQVIGVASNVAGLQDDDGQTEFCVGYAKFTKLSNQVDFIDSKIGKNNYCSVRSR